MGDQRVCENKKNDSASLEQWLEAVENEYFGQSVSYNTFYKATYERELLEADFLLSEGKFGEASVHYLNASSFSLTTTESNNAYKGLITTAKHSRDSSLYFLAVQNLTDDVLGAEGAAIARARFYFSKGDYDQAFRALKGKVVSDEALFWKTMCEIRVGDLGAAREDVTSMSSFGEGYVEGAQNFSHKAMFLYGSFSNEPDFSTFVEGTLERLRGSDLAALTSDYPEAISHKEILGVFKKIFTECSSNQKLIGSALSVMDYFRYYSDYNAKDPRAEFLSFLSSVGMSEAQFIKFAEKGIEYLADTSRLTSMKPLEEERILKLAVKAGKIFHELYPENFRFSLYLSRALRRLPENLDNRRASAKLMEKISVDQSTDTELKKMLLVERGVSWRDYTEVLIHEKKDDEETLNDALKKTTSFLEESALAYSDDMEMWNDLAWLSYSWGKKVRDFSDAIKLSNAIIARVNGKNAETNDIVGVSEEVLETLESAVIKSTPLKMAEIYRISGWSMSKQAEIDIENSRFDVAAQNAQNAVEVCRVAMNTKEVVARHEKRDASYCLAWSSYMQCIAQTNNIFKRSVPKDLSQKIDMPMISNEAKASCSAARDVIYENMFRSDLEQDLSEGFYAIARTQAERLEFGSLRRTYRNPLFHNDVEANSYYAEILGFLDMLEPEEKPDSTEIFSRADKEREQAKSFGTIEAMLMSFKKGRKDVRKRKIARDYLINALSYQIAATELDKKDREDNLLLIIKLAADNARESKNPADLAAVHEYFNLAKSWNLNMSRPLPMEYLERELTNIE